MSFAIMVLALIVLGLIYGMSWLVKIGIGLLIVGTVVPLLIITVILGIIFVAYLKNK